MTPHLITDVDQLVDICGTPHPKTLYKIQERFTEQARSFIQQSTFLVLTTISDTGEPTISPKGGVPGFVGLGEDDTLYLPDQRGNNLIFSLQNILGNSQVGLMFMLPGTCETLRIHGHAQLSDDPDLCAKYPIGKKPARLMTIIKPTTSYFHCSMSLRTGKLWEPDAWAETVKISWKEEIEPNLPAGEALEKDF